MAKAKDEMTHDEIEQQRLDSILRERAKAGNVIDMKAARIPCKVMNIEMPGERIEACVNGRYFSCAHGETVELTRGQIEAIRHSVVETFIDETDPDNPTGMGQTPGENRRIRKLTIPRYTVEIQTDEVDTLFKKMLETQGKASPSMVSGRTD